MKGCYITREVNGKTIEEVDYWNDGSIRFKKDNPFAVNLPKNDTKKPDAYSYYMYVEGSDLDTDILPIEIFPLLGSHERQKNSLVHKYKGKLPYKLKNKVYLNYNQETTWTRLSPSKVEVSGHLKFSVIKGKKAASYEYKAILEKVYCKKSPAKKKRMNILKPLKS